MRKLILAPMALACLIGAASAQQARTSTADQGKPGAAPWPVSWTGQSVLADLRVAGNPVATGNPVPVTVGNFPATQTISGSVTANLGTLNGAALDASVQAVKTALGSPFQAGGSIGNAAFGISGTLPAFAAIPTFKIDQSTPGTTNGVVVNSGTVAVGSPTVIADASGTITTANAFQTTAPESATRTFLLISNPDTSTPLAFRISGGAGLNAAGSITLAPGQTMIFDSRVPTGVVTVVGGTVGKPYTVIYTN